MKGIADRIRNLLTTDIKRAWSVGALHIGASRWIFQAAGIVQRILLARILGAANIGHIAVARSSLELLYLPASLGIYTPVTKITAELSGNPEEQNKVLSTGFYFGLIHSGLIMLVSFFLLKTTGIIADEKARELLSIIVLFLPLTILTRIIISWLAGRQKMQLIAKVEAFLPMFGLVTAVTLSYFWKLNGWLVNSIGIVTLGFCILLYIVRGGIRLSIDTVLLRRMLKIGIFAFLGQSVGTILLQFDTLCISGVLKDAEATGIYNTAALAYQQLMAVVGGILYTVFPYVAKNYDNIALLRKRYIELTFKLLTLSGAAGVVAWFVAPWFFPVFGSKFAGSVSPFRILLLGFLFRVQYVLVNTYLDALGRTDVTFVTGLFAAGINIVLNLLFIPRWGIQGAAWATVTSLFLSMVIREIALHYLIFHKKAVK